MDSLCEELLDQKSTITTVIGTYSEIARKMKGQERILEDFPWLWGIGRDWPVDLLRVTNSQNAFLQFISQNFEFKDFSRFEIWLKMRDGERVYLLNFLEYMTSIWHLRENDAFIFSRKRYADLLRAIPGTLEFLVLKRDKKMLLFRHRDRSRSLGEILNDQRFLAR